MSDLGRVRAAVARLSHLQPADADPLTTFLPALHHGRALHRNIVVVLGGRGAGKTALFRLVNDPRTSERVRALFETDLIPEAEWINAFSTGSTAHPDVGVLGAFAASASDIALRAFWMTHLLRRARDSAPDLVQVTGPIAAILDAPAADLSTWTSQAEASIGAVSAALDAAERDLEKARRTVVATYDNLDLIAPFVPGARRKAVAALLSLWLTLDERYRRLRGKVFLREDLFDAAELGFADASKLRSRAERLEWSPGDLFRVIIRHLVNGPDGADVRKWLDGTPVIHLADRGDLGWMVGPMSDQAQRVFAAKLGGRTIGRGVIKGATHEWILSRLLDAKRATTPRAMLSLVGFAAEEAERRGRSVDRGPVFGGAELLEALKLTSRDRVAEVKEETPAAVRLEALRGVNVPLSRQQATQLLSIRRPGEPDDIPEDGSLIVDELLRVGVLRVLDDGRIDVPDIFRYAFDIGLDYVGAWREFIEGKEQSAIDQFTREVPILREVLRKTAEETKLIEDDLSRGDWTAARAKLEQQLKLWEAAEDLERQQDTHEALSMIAVWDNNMPAARHHAETALLLAKKLRDPKLEAGALLMYSWTCVFSGLGEEADDAIRKAAGVIDQKGLVELQAGFFSFLASLSVFGDDRDRTAKLAGMALNQLRKSRNDEGVVQFFIVMAIVLVGRHNLNGAQLVYLADSASRALGGVGQEMIGPLFKGLRDGALKGLQSEPSGPAPAPLDAVLAFLRNRGDEAWRHDGGESLLREVLKAEPNQLLDQAMSSAQQTAISDRQEPTAAPTQS